MTIMKALTICQPFADMILKGEKIIENRTWSTQHRGRLAIHAGKSRLWMKQDDERERPDMTFGAIVATADLIDCRHVEQLPSDLVGRMDAEGPWCWLLQNVEPVTPPISARGEKGLWNWEPS